MDIYQYANLCWCFSYLLPRIDGLSGEAAAFQMKKYTSHRCVTEAFLKKAGVVEE
jgi:hypothetical protein